MKKTLLLCILLLVGCRTAPKDTLAQISTIDALLAGAYDGQMPLSELLTHGNLGLGTFNALEGEMIILDHQVYQALANGTVQRVDPATTTPFAAVVEFDADQTIQQQTPASLAELQAQIDRQAPNKNLFLAVRMDGTFPSMKVRSVPKQEKPYPPLAEVIQHQTVFEYTNVTGTVPGFRCPAFVKGINVPGYSLHFISADRKTGGHILDLTAGKGTLQLDACNRFFMVLTDLEQFAALDLSKDRTIELEKVEK